MDTECDNNHQEDMNESDFVVQRIFATVQGGSPEDSELKVISELLELKSNRNLETTFRK